MKIGILGTGMVGQAHAEKLSALGYSVMVGTRDPKKTAANQKPDGMGNPPFSEWHKKHPGVMLGTFEQAAAHGEVIINATQGEHSVEALKLAGAENLDGKVLIDISNALDFSKGMPPSLLFCNTDSLGERIQREFPKAKVVKTLNTVTAPLQVDPVKVAGGDHHVFLSGNDAAAKEKAASLLRSYGWKNIVDLGDITTARGTEMLMPMWLRLWGALKTPMFNYKIMG
ncbi:MAG: NAD(P)-binding domain-containing protein [Candidatus Micrarchaeia archaeon]